MRASELIGRTVIDRTGHPVGRIGDLRIPEPGATAPRLAGLVISSPGLRAALANAWGFAEGRASGPALVRRLLGDEPCRARYVPAEAVTAWDDPVRLTGRLEDYPLLTEELRR